MHNTFSNKSRRRKLRIRGGIVGVIGERSMFCKQKRAIFGFFFIIFVMESANIDARATYKGGKKCRCHTRPYPICHFIQFFARNKVAIRLRHGGKSFSICLIYYTKWRLECGIESLKDPNHH